MERKAGDLRMEVARLITIRGCEGKDSSPSG
jgi:hypothetical protein